MNILYQLIKESMPITGGGHSVSQGASSRVVLWAPFQDIIQDPMFAITGFEALFDIKGLGLIHDDDGEVYVTMPNKEVGLSQGSVSINHNFLSKSVVTSTQDRCDYTHAFMVMRKPDDTLAFHLLACEPLMPDTVHITDESFKLELKTREPHVMRRFINPREGYEASPDGQIETFLHQVSEGWAYVGIVEVNSEEFYEKNNYHYVKPLKLYLLEIPDEEDEDCEPTV